MLDGIVAEEPARQEADVGLSQVAVQLVAMGCDHVAGG